MPQVRKKAKQRWLKSQAINVNKQSVSRSRSVNRIKRINMIKKLERKGYFDE